MLPMLALLDPLDELGANEFRASGHSSIGLLLPETPGRWQEQHREEKSRVLRMEFKTFVNAFVTIPCQVLLTGRRLVLRLLGWNPHLMTFFRLASRLRR